MTLRLTIYLLLSSVISLGATPKDTLRAANEAMRNGAIADAIQMYEAIDNQHYGSFELYYNLGTAYALQEKWDLARLYLERAFLLDPKNPQVLTNLEMVKDKVNDLYRYPSYPFFGTIETLHSKVGQYFLSICLWILLISLGGACWIHMRWKVNLRLYYYALTVMIIVIAFFLVVERTHANFHERMAIVQGRQAAMYPHPEIGSSPLMDLAAGYKVRIEEHIGPWLKVDLADGTQGWIRESSVRSIYPNTQ